MPKYAVTFYDKGEFRNIEAKDEKEAEKLAMAKAVTKFGEDAELEVAAVELDESKIGVIKMEKIKEDTKLEGQQEVEDWNKAGKSEEEMIELYKNKFGVSDQVAKEDVEYLLKQKAEESIITIQEEVTVGNVILEKGDKIRVLKEASMPFWNVTDQLGNIGWNVFKAKSEEDALEIANFLSQFDYCDGYHITKHKFKVEKD